MKKGLVSKLNQLAHPTYLLSAFVIGLVLANNSSAASLVIAYFVTLAACIAILFKFKAAALIVFGAFGFLIGGYQIVTITQPTLSGCLQGKIDSRTKAYKTHYLYKISDLIIEADQNDLKISDQIKVCLGDPVKLEAKDRRFLLSQYKTARIYKANSIEKISAGSGFKNSLQALSENMQAKSAKLFSGDQGTLAYGVLFGGGDFSKELKNEFKKSGTTHIVAVSGYNVSIITTWLFTALREIGKNFAGIFSLIILIAFYFMTGGSASVLRAAVMGIIILLTKFIGRKVQALHLLLLAASLILAFNPFAIYDWGFQLSFMATAGLFFLAPVLETLLCKLKLNSSLTKTFCETVGAQIFVLPILVGNFGSFSAISPLSNLLILPIVPLLMGLVSVTLVVYSIMPLSGIFLAGLTRIVLTYIIFIVKISASIPFASINYQVSAPLAMILGYIIILSLTYILRRKYLKVGKDF